MRSWQICSKVLGRPRISPVFSALFWLHLIDIHYAGKEIILLWIREVLENIINDTGICKTSFYWWTFGGIKEISKTQIWPVYDLFSKLDYGSSTGKWCVDISSFFKSLHYRVWPSFSFTSSAQNLKECLGINYV